MVGCRSFYAHIHVSAYSYNKDVYRQPNKFTENGMGRKEAMATVREDSPSFFFLGQASHSRQREPSGSSHQICYYYAQSTLEIEMTKTSL